MTRSCFNLFVIACVFGMALFTALAADDKPKAKSEKVAKSEGKEKPKSMLLKPVSKDFQQLRKIAGLWKGQMPGHDGKPMELLVEYKLTSSKSVLVERYHKGSPMEMMSMYHDDGDGIMMTHYCGLGNQPRMKARGLKDGAFEFKFVDGTNMKSTNEMHMGGMKLTIVDKDRIRHHWTLFQGGKKAEMQMPAFELTRVKKQKRAKAADSAKEK